MSSSYNVAQLKATFSYWGKERGGQGKGWNKRMREGEWCRKKKEIEVNGIGEGRTRRSRGGGVVSARTEKGSILGKREGKELGKKGIMEQ